MGKSTERLRSMSRPPAFSPVSSRTSRRAARRGLSPGLRLPVTDCQNWLGRARRSMRISPPRVQTTTSTDWGRL